MEPAVADWAGRCPRPCYRLLEDLSPEILYLIFEELYKKDGSDACKPVRLVSRTLCAAVVPSFYRDINFKPDNTSKPFSPAFRYHLDVSFENAYTYARNARIDCKMNWVAVAAFLFKCRQLERLDWAYWDDVEPNKSPIPTVIQDFIRTKSPPVRLYVWQCSIPWSRTTAAQMQSLPQFSHLASIPTSHLACLSMCRPMSGGRDFQEVLAQLVTSSPLLDSIELYRITSRFHGNKRLPPIKHLSLNRSYWRYTADEVARIWDFSRLETLRITNRSHAVEFLRSVSSKVLPCLKRLAIEVTRSIPPPQDHSEMVGRFLLESPLLLELELTTGLWSLPIASITRHSSLRVLSLKDRMWTNGRRELAATIAIPDLESIEMVCKHIAELTLDVRDCDIFHTLAVLSKFRSLREVTLRVPTRLLQKGENDNSIDIDYHSANQMAVYLSSRKKGVAMEKLSVDVGVYNSVSGPYTAEWSTQRAKGHIPERFFIFSWDEVGEINFEEVKGKLEPQQSIKTLGLAKWLKVHKFPPN